MDCKGGYEGESCFDCGDGSTCAQMCVKSLQSCLTLCELVDGSPPGPSVCGILQARIPTGVGCHALLRGSC